MKPREQWEWFGKAAHLIVGVDCRFHLATFVGKYLVSTVGEWLPDSDCWDIYAKSRGVQIEGRGDARRADFMRKVGYIEIGCDRKYETLVFDCSGGKRCVLPECNCGQPLPDSYSELDGDGYNDARSATKGHLAMCEKWAAQ